MFLHTTKRFLWKARMVDTVLRTKGTHLTQEHIGEGKKRESREFRTSS